MAIAVPVSRPPASASPSAVSASAQAPTPSTVRPTRRGAFGLAALLALYAGVPWVVRPLEWLLPAARVAMIGQLLETTLGIVLGVWAFWLIRRQRALSLRHASEMERVTEVDALTGLGNGRALARELGQALNRARRSGEPVTVLCLDVNELDEVNRRHGRGVGDQALRALGAVMRSTIRFGSDAAYRIGAGEFALVLSADRAAAHGVGRRVEGTFRERTPRGSGLGMGVAAWDGCATADRLVEEARRALDIQRRTVRAGAMA